MLLGISFEDVYRYTMDWFLLSYHSISVFTVLVISLIISMFLAVKREKSVSSFWLMGVFLGYVFMYLGYFIGYSVYSPTAAYHSFLTVLVIFGISCFVAFSYHYPRNDFPKESRLVIPSIFLLSVASILYYIIRSYSLDLDYNFSQHSYSKGNPTVLNVLIFLLHIWCFIILVRKTIIYSEYESFLPWENQTNKEITVNKKAVSYSANLFMRLLSFIRPKGKDANSIKGFSKAIILLSSVAFANVLNSTQLISNETFAYILSSLSLILSFYIIIIYLNNSPEVTSFVVKLVGISLVTLLLVVGYVGHIILSMSEADYDTLKMTELKNSKKNILIGNFDEISENIQYVLRKPRNDDSLIPAYELVYSREDIISLKEIIDFEKKEKEKLVRNLKEKFKRTYITTSKEDMDSLIRSEVSSNKLILDKRLYRNAGIFYIHYDFVYANYIYEVGYSYFQYREYTHKNVSKLFYAILFTTIAIVILFPKFFKDSLVQPLYKLRLGVERVNKGNLDILVPVVSHDEIGFLADSFNTMVLSLKDMKKQMERYTETLEEKVMDRTKEVQDKNHIIAKLKAQQDGDYFLTSLLARPLNHNSNRSSNVKTEFIVKQKNQFSFKDKSVEIGGDICITGNIQLGKKDKPESFVFVFNGDAMGKSLQGAGGALILGVVVNSMLARNTIDTIPNLPPQRWLEGFLEELNAVFQSFDGFILASASLFLVNQETGEAYCINAGHPRTILYRNKKAGFIEPKNEYTRLGLEIKIKGRVQVAKLLQGDIVFIGSDGKDHIQQKKNNQINDNESLILNLIELSLGNLNKLEEEILKIGTPTDDFSIIKLEYQKPVIKNNISKEELFFGDEKDEILIAEEEIELETPIVNELYVEGKKLYNQGQIEKAIEVLTRAFDKDANNQKINKLFGLVCFKGKQYEKAILVLNKYLTQDPKNNEMWYYMSLAQRKIGDYIQSIESAERFYQDHPDNVQNLVNLSDLYRIKGDYKVAKFYSQKAAQLDPTNKSVKKILETIGTKV
jgi:tetratricopeptide (TPR) repeat protein/HAMP domain-containing protein